MDNIGTLTLRYKSVNMKRVVGCWKGKNGIYLAC